MLKIRSRQQSAATKRHMTKVKTLVSPLCKWVKKHGSWRELTIDDEIQLFNFKNCKNGQQKTRIAKIVRHE